MKIKSKHLAIGAAVFTLGIGLFSCILIGSCFLLPFVATNRDPEITVSGRAEFAGLDGDEALFDMLEMMGDDPADPDKLREADNKVTEVISICTDSGNTYLCHFRPGE